MTKTIITIIAVLIVVILASNISGVWPFLNKPLNYLVAGPVDKTCQQDSDCVIRQTQCGYCTCGQAVNKNWQQYCLFKNHFFTIYCSACPPWQTFCEKGQCQQKFNQPVGDNGNQTSCTMEAMLCPDGSAVGRSGPNCEFAACPGADKPSTTALSETQARVIAEKSCIKGGEALSSGVYNENTQTWWFEANLNATKEGCNPACVVSEATQTAEINWRCTGLIIPTN